SRDAISEAGVLLSGGLCEALKGTTPQDCLYVLVHLGPQAHARENHEIVDTRTEIRARKATICPPCSIGRVASIIIISAPSEATQQDQSKNAQATRYIESHMLTP